MTESAAAPFMIQGTVNVAGVTLFFAPEAGAFLAGLAQRLSELGEANMQIYWGFYDQDQQGYIAWKVWVADRAAEFIFPEPSWSYLAKLVQSAGDVEFTGAEYATVQKLGASGQMDMEEFRRAIEPTIRFEGVHLAGVAAFLELVKANRLQHPVVTKKILRQQWQPE